MGVLDNVFGGDNGISAILHRLLGGNATIRLKNYSRNAETGELVPSFEDVKVPFVPNNADNSLTPLSASGVSRSDIRENSDTLSGTFPCSALKSTIKPQRDSIIFFGQEFQIETVDTLKVGDVDVQFSITARRC